MMTTDPVRDYYPSFGEREWARLENPDDGAVEFQVTRYMLARYLPSQARILDIGGGPGRYTIWQAQQGHRVVPGAPPRRVDFYSPNPADCIPAQNAGDSR